MTFCPYCGTRIQQGLERCPKCDMALAGGSSPDPRGSTLMGVSSLKNDDAAPEGPKPSGPADAVVLSDGLSAGKVATPLKLPKISDSAETATAPMQARSDTATPIPNAPRTSPSGSSKTSDHKKPSTSTNSNSWDSNNINASGVGMMPATDSLMMRAGDVIDPVTGLPIRAFKQKPKSKVPLIVGGVMLAGIAALLYYISNRPAPPVNLAITEQLASGEGAPIQLTIDTGKAFGAEAIKIKGVEAKPEQNIATVSLPDDAVPVGKSQLPAEVQIEGKWRDAVPIEITRAARAKVSIDKAKERLAFDFEVMDGGTAINLFGKEEPVVKGKAHFDLPFRAATSPADMMGATEIEKEASYQITGIDGDFSFTFKFPAPKPIFTPKTPTDYTVVEKKIDKIAIEFDAANDATVTVTANKDPLKAEAGKYTANLKADENIIEIKVEVKDTPPVITTLHIWRGTPPAGWNKNEAKPKDSKDPKDKDPKDPKDPKTP